MKINTTVLPQGSTEKSMLQVKLSTSSLEPPGRTITAILRVYRLKSTNELCAENGKEIELDIENMRIGDIIQEVDRHSRALNRQAELAGER